MKKTIAIILSIMLILAITLPAAAVSSVPVKSVKLDKTSMTIKVGDSENLNISFTPSNTTQTRLTYITSNKNVATIDASGKITALHAGKVTITVMTANKKVYAKCSVTIPQPPIVNLSVEVFDRSNAPAGAGTAYDNAFTKKIQEKFGTPNSIALKYVPVPRSQEEDKLAVLMASGTAPDIVFTYNKGMYQQFAKQGGLTDLTEYVNNTTNLKPYMEKMKTQIQYKGKYMAMAATRTDVAAHMSYIRTDWLEKLNMKAPKTTNEWYAVMKAFKEKDPGETGGTVIPWGISARPYIDNHDLTMQMLWSFVKADEKQIMTLPYLMLPGWKDGLKLVNKMYNEGLISPEFALDQNNTKLKAGITSGKIGFFTVDDGSIYGKPDELYTNLTKNAKGAKLDPIECFKNPDGKYPKIVSAAYGLLIMVPKTSKADAAKAAVKYMDWLYSTEGAKFTLWGEEGRNYTLTNGMPAVNDEQYKINAKERFNTGDIAIAFNGPYNPNPELIYKQIELGDPIWGKEAAASKKLAGKDGFIDLVSNSMFERPITASGKYQGNLDNLYLNGLAKLIMAKTADFDKSYDALLADYMKNGGQEVMDEKVAAYAEMGR